MIMLGRKGGGSEANGSSRWMRRTGKSSSS